MKYNLGCWDWSKYIVLFVLFFFYYNSVSFASSTQTTIYFSTIEKNLENGESKIFYAAGNGMGLRVINSGKSDLSYLHSDHLGSAVFVTKQNGIKDSSIVYYPFGKETTTISSKTDKLYTGQRKDTSSNLYFYNARFYNPNSSHFISGDKAEGPNRYAYVGNNPIMKNDPSGNMQAEDSGAGGDYAMYMQMLEEEWKNGPDYWAWEMTKGSYNLWHSDLSFLTKFIGEVDMWLGHSFSNAAAAFNSPILNWNSGASIKDRARMVGKGYLNTFIFASQVAPVVQGGVGLARSGANAINGTMTNSLDDAFNWDMKFVSGSGIDYESIPIIGAKNETFSWNVGIMRNCETCMVEGNIGFVKNSKDIVSRGNIGMVKGSSNVIAGGEIGMVKGSSNVIAGGDVGLVKGSSGVYTVGDVGGYINSSGIVGGDLGIARNSSVIVGGQLGYAKRSTVEYANWLLGR